MKKRTLRDILCDVSGVTEVPLDPFRFSPEGPTSCEERNPMEPKKVCVADWSNVDNYTKDLEREPGAEMSMRHVLV